MYVIRDTAAQIAIRQSYATGDFIDLGGKEMLVDETRLLLQDLGFITILLIPYTDGKKPGTDQAEDFERYYQLFYNNPELIDEAKRRNIHTIWEDCAHDWSRFKVLFKSEIWDRRYDLYHHRPDIVINRGNDSSGEDGAKKLADEIRKKLAEYQRSREIW
jgi:hypothetical protein